MLGHAAAKEKLNTYAKIFPGRKEQATEKMTKARERAPVKEPEMSGQILTRLGRHERLRSRHRRSTRKRCT